MRLRNAFVCLSFALAVVTACSSKPAAPAPASTKPAAAEPPSTGGEGVRTVSGTVQETMNAAGYTYVRVKTPDSEIWAATGQMEMAVGDRVTVPLQMAINNFRSPTLKREFPVLYFVSDIQRQGHPSSSAAAAAPLMPAHATAASAQAGHGSMGQSGAMGGQAPQVTVGRVPTPEGGMTIADVWSKRESLSGKTVTVRGKVVKFNGEILNRNWMHIQDGTGDAKAGTHDLTVTSQGVAKVGDIVTATGKVSVNKDFGAGYAYPVMLDGATIAVK